MLRLDHIAQFYNLDASETVFFERALLDIRSQVYTKQFHDLKAMEFLPLQPGLNPGSTHFTYQYLEHFGNAVLGADMSSAGPRADVKRSEETPIAYRDIVDSYGYSIQEIRSAMMGNMDLVTQKAIAARQSIEQVKDNVLLLGDGTSTYFGCYGLFKLSGTATYTVPSGLGGVTFGAKTPDEVIADLHGICNGVHTGSGGVETAKRLILPLTSWTDIATRRMGDGSNETILTFFLKVRQQMTPGFQVMSSTKLETAGSGSAKRMVAYDPSKVARLDSVEFEQFAPQLQGFMTIVNCHARTAGVYTAFPKSVSYGDGI